jgi:hypothetical protein
VTHHQRLDPGPPRLIRGQQDHGLWRAATSLGATATRNTPVAQSEEVATCRRRLNAGRPRARTHRPATQRHGDSDHRTATYRSCRTTKLRCPLSDRCCPWDVRLGHVRGLLTVGTAAHQGAARRTVTRSPPPARHCHRPGWFPVCLSPPASP